MQFVFSFFRSPEVLIEGIVTFSADVYAVGVLLW